MSADTPGYDLRALQEISSGDKAFYEEMVRLFLQTTSGSLYELQRAAKLNNWKLAGAIAHKMRGPCNHIGAESFCFLLARIESEAENNLRDEGILTVLVDQVCREGQTLLTAISADTGIHS